MLQKSNISRVLGLFFSEPTKEHYLMDISRKIGLAHTSVKKVLLKLVKSGLVREKSQKKGRRKFPVYIAETDNVNFKRHKAIHNLSLLFDSGMIDFLEKKFSPNSIVVFGSYRRGEDIEESDIDIFVETVEEAVDLSSFEKLLRRKVQLHFNKNFHNYPKELRNNIINGIVLHGFLEGYK